MSCVFRVKLWGKSAAQKPGDICRRSAPTPRALKIALLLPNSFSLQKQTLAACDQTALPFWHEERKLSIGERKQLWDPFSDLRGM